MKKRILVLAFAVVSCLIFLSAGVLAEETTYEVTNPYLFGSEAGVIINGHYTYCVDPGLAWPEDKIQYTEGAELDKEKDEIIINNKEAIIRALEGGYPLDEFGFSELEPTLKDQFRGFYTQQVIWAILGNGTAQSIVNNTKSPNSYCWNLYQYATTGEINGQVPAKIKVNYVVTPKLSNNTTNSKSLSFKADAGATLKVETIPSGVTLELEENSSKINVGSKVLSSDKLIATIPKKFDGGDIQFSYSIRTGVDQGALTLFSTTSKARDPKTGGEKAYQRMLGYQYTEKSETLNVSLASNIERGTIALTKVDKDYKNIKLSDAVFAVCTSKTKNVVALLKENSATKGLYDKLENVGDYTLPTGFQKVNATNVNDSGILYLNDSQLVTGTYDIYEIKSPDGYLSVSNTVSEKVTLSDTNLSADLGEISNTIETAQLKLHKIDNNTKSSLEGVSFSLAGTDIRGITYKQTKKTNNNGDIVFDNIPVGNSYELTETPLTGYAQPKSYNVQVTAGENNAAFITIKDNDGNTLTATEDVYTITNTKIPYEPEIKTYKLSLEKKGDDGKTVSGAVYALYRKSDNAEINRYTTGADGTVKVSGLSSDNYYLKEISAPNGYLLNPEATDVTITNTNVSVNVTDAAMKLYISKQDISNGKELSGAKLTITDTVTNKVVTEWVSDASVKTIDTSDFVADRVYVLTETKAPDGYNVAESIQFKIGADSKGQSMVSVLNNGQWTAVDNQTVIMKDAASSNPGNPTGSNPSAPNVSPSAANPTGSNPSAPNLSPNNGGNTSTTVPNANASTTAGSGAGTGTNNGSGSNGSGSNGSGSGSSSGNANTGVNGDSLPVAAAALCALGALVISATYKRKRDK